MLEQSSNALCIGRLRHDVMKKRQELKMLGLGTEGGTGP